MAPAYLPLKKRRERRKRVTLIAGMVCFSSVVIAADSQESGTYRKSKVEKIYSRKVGKDQSGCSLIVAGSGSVGGLIDYAAQKIIARVGHLENIIAVENGIEVLLQEIYQT